MTKEHADFITELAKIEGWTNIRYVPDLGAIYGIPPQNSINSVDVSDSGEAELPAYNRDLNALQRVINKIDRGIFSETLVKILAKEEPDVSIYTLLIYATIPQKLQAIKEIMARNIIFQPTFDFSKRNVS